MKSILQIILFSILCNNLSFSQVQNLTSEETTISGGAEYVRQLQKAIREGKSDIYRIINPSPMLPVEFNSTDAITTFDGPNFDDNATYNGGYVFIPPDPIGVAGTDRVISVINCLIECRTKAGSLLWIDDLAGFFSILSVPAGNYTFDPKVIYDQYEDRFVVVDLELVESGSNPDPGNTSRILLAVSKTSTPGSATSTDWWYLAISAEESIGGLDYWADYPGFAVDEEAVYVTANMFVHDPYVGGPLYNRLWIVDKGTSSGFYSGGTASYTGGWNFPSLLSDPNVGTHQPAHVFGSTGVASGVGTFLLMYDGLTTGELGGVEAIKVVRVDDPLGTPTFIGPEYVFLGNLEDIGGSLGFPALPDAPQSGSAIAY